MIRRIKWPGWLLLLILVIVVSSFFFSLLKKNTETIQAQEVIVSHGQIIDENDQNFETKYSGIDVVSKTKQTEIYTSSIVVPETGIEAIDKNVHEWLRNKEKEFLEQVDLNKDIFNEEHLAHLNIQMTTQQITSHIYSFIFSNYQYYGGANGNQDITTFTIDLKKGKILELEEVLAVNKDSVDTIYQLAFSLLQEDEERFSFVFEDQLKDALTKPTNWKWSLSSDVFSLYFDKYEIAAGAVGLMQVDIPLDEILTYINEDILIDSEKVEVGDIDKEIIESEWKELDPNGKYVALTFDDGPHPKVTPQVLDTLSEYGAKATFYMLGTQVEYYPGLVQEVARLGHEIGNHSMSHPNLVTLEPKRIKHELEETSLQIEEAVGFRPSTMRPPYGSYNDGVISLISDIGIPMVLWSVDSLDWKSRDKDEINKVILNNVHDGAIILMHDIHQATADALPHLMKELDQQGYEFVTVSELLEQNHGEIGPHSKR
ncbi:polysaccharide deacetylase family protein [Alkalihalobacillus sp. 1P02AB]|uniref:polysaccharide deacetylase family protein n=1 Tax=Alkalihalobacillus sp. 1P02AB TaxID=3132260 RepID=UPI0039A66440